MRGTLESSVIDTLVLGTVVCPVASVTRLDISRGRHRRTRKGALIGGVVGGGLGLVSGVAALALADNVFPEAVGLTVLNTAINGGFGALVGAGIGALSRTDRWEEVPLDGLRVGIAPQRDRFALGLSVRF